MNLAKNKSNLNLGNKNIYSGNIGQEENYLYFPFGHPASFINCRLSELKNFLQKARSLKKSHNSREERIL